ncbi:hypothetical protein [Flavobacterium sp.]|uniref:hypothetical protein n=1 Tax=Flavobacterium sp. TaxID=239 RepID=UPI00260C8F67|nr:hypothetical protein [Flavobacterium sp.]
MKKKLEAELISIAHRILKLKNKSELHQLHQEAQNLYEKLSVLRFVEDHFAEVKPTIGRAEIEDKIEAAFEAPAEQPIAEVEEEITIVAQTEEDQQTEEALPLSPKAEEEATDEEHEVEIEESEPVAETEASEEIAQETETEELAAEETEETSEEEIKTEALDFKPAFELSFDTKDEEIQEQIKEEIKNVSPQITFDDLLGPDYVDPVFVKPEELEKEKATQPSNVIPIGRSYNDAAPVISLNKDQSTSLNDRLSKGIIIGLNDRIAFMSNLFANSSEDYNRVLSQLMTFDTFEEAKNFIDNMVKPDYDNWEGKDEYAERFMEIIEKRFS